MGLKGEFEEVKYIFFRTYYGRRAIRFFIFLTFASFFIFLSLRFSGGKYKEQAGELERKISIIQKEIVVRDVKREVENLEQILSLWRLSKTQSQGVYLFLIRLSNVISKSIKIDRMEIIPTERKLDFVIYGKADNPRNIYNFSRRLNKKTGDFIVHSEIVRFDTVGGNKTEFIMKGYFALAIDKHHRANGLSE